MTMLFYCVDHASLARAAPAVLEGVQVRFWRPATDGLPPHRSRWFRNLLWWGFSRLGLFARPDFTEITLWRGERLLHRLIVTPRWRRFPFMASDDLQLGDLWTHPEARGQGIAHAAVAAAHRRFAGRTRRFWYVVHAENIASIRLVESCGYRLVGRGRRTSPLGIRAAGRFRLDTPAS